MVSFISISISLILLHFCSFGVSEVEFTNSSNGFENKDYRLVLLQSGGVEYKGLGTKFEIFCQKDLPKSVVYIWRSVYLLLENVPAKYKLYSGENGTEVYEKYMSQTIWHPISWISWQDTQVSFPAFNKYCVGIKANERFTVKLEIRSVSYWKVLQSVFGIFLFVSAATLSRNVMFHYASGMSLGVLASVLVLLYVLSRFIPKKGASYAIMLFGYSVVLYYLQQFYNYLPDIIANYLEILIAYVFFSALISFIVCYRFGPVGDVKTIQLIQWGMQSAGLVLIFFSSEYREVSTVMILILLTYHFIPSTWTGRAKAIWMRYFPPQVKLLTETEYIEQGDRETKKAIEELRRFCNSPDCQAWKTVSRLKSPSRFASFVEGSSHLSDDEMMLYDSEAASGDDVSLTDDEDSGVISNNHSNSIVN